MSSASTEVDGMSHHFPRAERLPAPIEILCLIILPGVHLSPICHFRRGTLLATKGKLDGRHVVGSEHGIGEIILFLLFVSCVLLYVFLLARGY
jgi:hypothetical protein